jgi:hypothetical protein
MITVQELIRLLEKQHPFAVVILPKDREGNDYSPLDDIDTGYYEPENSYSGQVYEEPSDSSHTCVTLWPVN